MSNHLPILAEDIRLAHADVRRAAKWAAARAIDAGNALIEAKALVKHGAWLPWLKENCALSDRTARLYMQLAKSGMKSATVADLGVKAASRALAQPKPVKASRFICLPEEPGLARLGLWKHKRDIEVLFVREHYTRPGYYWLVHTCLPMEGDATSDMMAKPIRCDAVSTVIETMAPALWADRDWVVWRDVPPDHLDAMAGQMEALFDGRSTDLSTWRGEVRP